MKTENCLAKLLLIGEEPKQGTLITGPPAYKGHKGATYSYLGRSFIDNGDIKGIHIGLFRTSEKGWCFDYSHAGNWIIAENQDINDKEAYPHLQIRKR